MFKDRKEAAFKLAQKLNAYKNQDGIVLAIPRGGVPVAEIIAKELAFPLEIFLSKKIGHPNNPEYAIGSVSLNSMVLNENVKDIPIDYIQKKADHIQDQLKEKFRLYMDGKKPADLKNKIVILVDDGIATGSTILASISAIKKSNPKKIIVAVPVAPIAVANKISKEVDEFICLFTPFNFQGVGQFYDDFSQVSDAEVIQLLRTNKTPEKIHIHKLIRDTN